MEIAGALAHQSHQVQSHSNVLSVKFFEGEDRVISGHVHMNGRVDYSRERLRSGQKERWKPTRDQVEQNSWTVYDPEKKKHRKVFQEQGWFGDMDSLPPIFTPSFDKSGSTSLMPRSIQDWRIHPSTLFRDSPEPPHSHVNV
ncbi:hypothetical protein MANI_026363 [Metarhizium anisopliae]|nr:hypothetical protein MANI_026363 [Metarhizium anisopliae]